MPRAQSRNESTKHSRNSRNSHSYSTKTTPDQDLRHKIRHYSLNQATNRRMVLKRQLNPHHQPSHPSTHPRHNSTRQLPAAPRNQPGTGGETGTGFEETGHRHQNPPLEPSHMTGVQKDGAPKAGACEEEEPELKLYVKFGVRPQTLRTQKVAHACSSSRTKTTFDRDTSSTTTPNPTTPTLSIT